MLPIRSPIAAHLQPSVLLLSSLFLLLLTDASLPGCSKDADTAKAGPTPAPHIDKLAPVSVPFKWKGTVKVNGDHSANDCIMLGFCGNAKARCVSATILEVDIDTTATDQAGTQTVKADEQTIGTIINDVKFTFEAAKPGTQ